MQSPGSSRTRFLIGPLLVGCISFASAQSPATAPPTDRARAANVPQTPRLSSIVSRAPDGRVATFKDPAEREFRFNYGVDGRLVSVNATKGNHASDIHDIVYGQHDDLIEVRFRNGYSLHFLNANDGVVVIRDRFGGVLTRHRGTMRPESQVVHADPSGKLAEAVSGLYVLLNAAAR
jgi:YD repeat-containing protein